ncbi:LacI family DNA-binding transcriptional regulator [Cellulomonas sp. JZ18]|uniref:LacI family DNA-binding transcriptional regulator n=1 Tax=Cellulomonas sp. JZ18 TaxID=2654191 RepID=UPI0012D47409|nr:LacI family DNA-binding transcriptional regulator [Cellulomonas sp. JZ18]QGQ18826.1 LacI family DNA-binding transcriptional regulator [Cellulomonas sp. JZ18]
MPARRVTSKDVARRAGVSQSTVSYVLNDAPNQSISRATRERVRQAAEELGYAPSAAARALRRGSTDTVLAVLPDAPVGGALIALVRGMSDMLEPHGHTVVSRRQRDTSSLRQLWQELMPAAIANLAAFPPAEEAAMEAAGIPVVGVSLEGGSGRTVRVPQDLIGRTQAEHLVRTGRTRLAFAAPTDPHLQAFAQGRLTGVRQTCEALGLPEPVVVDVPLHADAAGRAVRRMREREDPVTGICAYNDEVALAVLAGLRETGVAVPAEVAVVGVDNLVAGRLAAPPLTTVDIRPEEVGSTIGRHVLRRLKPGLGLPEPDDEPSIELVVRASS